MKSLALPIPFSPSKVSLLSLSIVFQPSCDGARAAVGQRVASTLSFVTCPVARPSKMELHMETHWFLFLNTNSRQLTTFCFQHVWLPRTKGCNCFGKANQHCARSFAIPWDDTCSSVCNIYNPSNIIVQTLKNPMSIYINLFHKSSRNTFQANFLPGFKPSLELGFGKKDWHDLQSDLPQVPQFHSGVPRVALGSLALKTPGNTEKCGKWQSLFWAKIQVGRLMRFADYFWQKFVSDTLPYHKGHGRRKGCLNLVLCF